MSILHSILQSAHCRNVYQFLALDALECLETAQSQRLAKVLWVFHHAYLGGCKASPKRSAQRNADRTGRSAKEEMLSQYPDVVKAVLDAAHHCHVWFDSALESLDAGRWKKAAYACGALGRCFTEPIVQLHGGENHLNSKAQKLLEWSIYSAFDQIRQRRQQSQMTANFAFSYGDDWLIKAVLAASDMASQHREPIVKSYWNALESTHAPPIFDTQSLDTLAKLGSIAIGGWASMLSRLADETTIELPQTSLRRAVCLAAIDTPQAWAVRNVSNWITKQTARFGLGRLRASGLFAPAIQSSSQRAMDANERNTLPIKANDDESNQTANGSTRRLDAILQQVDAQENLEGAGTDKIQPKILSFEDARIRHSESSSSDDESKLDLHESTTTIPQDSSQTELPTSIHSTSTDEPLPELPSERTNRFSNFRNLSAYRTVPSAIELPSDHRGFGQVHFNSPLVDAPSIGPKTAKRFERVGVHTIGHFLRSKPADLEASLDLRWISAPLIADWQDQARLVCEIPALCGYQAQLLVAIGCRTGWQLRTSDPARLARQIIAFVETSEGQQILRSTAVPTLQDVASWVDSAQSHARPTTVIRAAA